MADFKGTSGADTLDQATLGLADGTAIYGQDGDDRISFSNGIAIGGAGADTLIPLQRWSTIAYWDSPAGVTVDLAAGTASDGYGSTDTLVNAHTVHGSRNADTLRGSSTDDSFYGAVGDDRIEGRAGTDTVRLLFQPRSDFQLVYDDASGDLRVSTASGSNKGSKFLSGIEFLEFQDQTLFVRSLASSGFTVQAGARMDNADAAGNPRWVTGDFNADGRSDIAVRYDPASSFSTVLTGASPLRMYLQQPDGALAFAGLQATAGVAPTLVNRIVAADFNRDGKTDIVISASGQDPYLDGKPVGPWPGERSYVLMSTAGSGFANLAVPGIPKIFAHHAVTGDINGDRLPDVFVDSIWMWPDAASYFLISDGKGAMTFSRDGVPTSLVNSVQYKVGTEASGAVRWDLNTYTASALIDANGDGSLDLAVLPGSATQNGKVFLNDGGGHFSDSRRIELPPGPFGAGYSLRQGSTEIGSYGSICLDSAVLDVNGDGRQDLVTIATADRRDASQYVYYSGAALQILVNTGSGFVDESASRTNFTHPGTDGNYGAYDTVRAVDFDQDGFVDLVVYRSDGAPVGGAGPTRILHNDGHGVFREVAYPAGVPYGLFVDVDAAAGRYAVLRTFKTGTDAASGLTGYAVEVDAVTQDWSAGRDFFTGAPRLASALQSDIPGRWVHGTDAPEQITLSTGNERAFGHDGNDVFRPGPGNDTVDGGAGVDTVVFSGPRADFQVSGQPGQPGQWLVTATRGSEGSDALIATERLVFADRGIALDLDGDAGKVVKLLGATFGAAAVKQPAWVGAGLQLLAGGMGYEQLARVAVDYRLGAAPTDAQVVDLLYGNVVGTPPPPGDRSYFVGLLQSGQFTQGSLAVLAAETALNAAGIGLVGLAATGVEFT